MTAPIAGYLPVFFRNAIYIACGRIMRSPIAISIWEVGPTTIPILKICKPSVSTLIVLSKWYEKTRYNGEEQKNKQYIEKKIFTNIIEILTCSCWMYESIALGDLFKNESERLMQYRLVKISDTMQSLLNITYLYAHRTQQEVLVPGSTLRKPSLRLLIKCESDYGQPFYTDWLSAKILADVYTNEYPSNLKNFYKLYKDLWRE